MRLLIVITDLELGGTPTVVRELALRLRDDQTHVEVASLKPPGIVGEQLRSAGVVVHLLEARSPLLLKAVARRLASIVQAREFDLVFSFLVHANVVSHLASKRWGYRARLIQSIQTTQPKPRWHWLAQRMVRSSATRFVVPSESVARRAGEWSKIDRSRIDVIPNAVDVDRFTLATPSRDADGFRIGFVGRLDPVKRVEDLIEAMAMLADDVTLEIVGDGSERERLVALAGASRDLHRRVRFSGSVVDVASAYARFDALVLPSDAEGFGLVLIEAMASGVAVIATDVDGIRDVVDHEQTGLLVAPREPEQIARAIERLRADESLRRRLIDAGRARVRERYAYDAVIGRYRDVLGAALD